MSEFERGVKEGRIDAKLEDHARHLETINGSVERSAAALENVVTEVRELRVAFETQVRTAKLVAETLAAETERRREALADTAITDDRQFTKRQQIAGLALATITVIVTVYLATQ